MKDRALTPPPPPQRTISTAHILNTMKKIGYPVQDGVCLGYGLMAAQASFVSELDKMDSRVEFIFSRPNLVEEIAENRKRLKKRSQLLVNKKDFWVTKTEQLYNDIRAYFDGIYIYDSPDNLNALMGQALTQHYVDEVSYFAASTQLSDQYGGMHTVSAWCGVYTEAGLDKYLDIFPKDCYLSNLDVPFTILILGYDHAFVINYNGQRHTWAMRNINDVNKPKIDYPSRRAFKLALNRTLLGKSCAFETRVITAGIYVDKIREYVCSVRSASIFKQLHRVTRKHCNRYDYQYVGLMMLAVQNNHLGLLRKIIKYQQDLNIMTSDSVTFLYEATTENYADIVEFLCANGANVNIKKDNDNFPLYAAVEGGHLSIVKTLCLAGADVNMTTLSGQTALHVSVLEGGNVADIILFLIEAGANVNAKTLNNSTPLLFAARNGFVLAVSILLSNGADVNLASLRGVTPALAAAMKGHLEVLKLLSQAGVDLTVAPTGAMGSPLDMAIKYKHQACVDYITGPVAHPVESEQDELESGYRKRRAM